MLLLWEERENDINDFKNKFNKIFPWSAYCCEQFYSKQSNDDKVVRRMTEYILKFIHF